MAILPSANLASRAGEGRSLTRDFEQLAGASGWTVVDPAAIESALESRGERVPAELSCEQVREVARVVKADLLLSATVLAVSSGRNPSYALECRLLQGDSGKVRAAWLGGSSEARLETILGPPHPHDVAALRRALAAKALDRLQVARRPPAGMSSTVLRSWSRNGYTLTEGSRVLVFPLAGFDSDTNRFGFASARAIATALDAGGHVAVVPQAETLAAFEKIGVRSFRDLDGQRLQALGDATGARCLLTGRIHVALDGGRGPSEFPSIVLRLDARELRTGRYVWSAALGRRGGIQTGILARDLERSLAELIVSGAWGLAASFAERVVG